jgi:hypothetical protein
MKLKLVSNKIQMSLNLKKCAKIGNVQFRKLKTRLKLALREPTKQIFMSKLRLRILFKGKVDQHWHNLDIETNIKLITS